MRKVKGEDVNWLEGTGEFVWPEGVEVEFPNGDVYDGEGGRDKNGDHFSFGANGKGTKGSPCHQALVKAGVLD